MRHTDWDSQRERLSAYLDSELSSTERAELDGHLAGCGECQRELAALRQTRGLLGALPTPALPRSFTLPETPAAAIPRKGGAQKWARPAQALGGMAAAIGLGLLIASALPHPSAQRSAAATANPDTVFGGAASTAASAPVATPGGASATPTTTDTASGAAAHTPAYRPETPTTQPFPVLPLTGGTLLVGGAAALTLGSLARRRGGDLGLPEPEPAD